MTPTIKNLEKCFAVAKEREMNFIGVKIQMLGFNQAEVIIHPYDNFNANLEYYKEVYNDDLTLKAFNGIKIIGFTYGDDFMEIEEDLLG